MTQAETVLDALKAGPKTTVQLHNLPYITNVRARVSDLRAKGYIIQAEPIKGRHQSLFTLRGQSDMMAIEPDAKKWRQLPNGGGVYL